MNAKAKKQKRLDDAVLSMRCFIQSIYKLGDTFALRQVAIPLGLSRGDARRAAHVLNREGTIAQRDRTNSIFGGFYRGGLRVYRVEK